jgi:hypothetical protein
MSSNPINLEKKQSAFGLFQDIYTLTYCLILIPIAKYNIFTNSNIIDWKLDSQKSN